MQLRHDCVTQNVSALAALESTVVATAMPTIVGDLEGLAVYSWVFSLYLLSATVMMPLAGRLADLYGRRRVLLAALTLFLAGAGLCALAPSMGVLIAARGLQGLGAAGLLPISLTVDMAIVSANAERQRRARKLVDSVASLPGRDEFELRMERELVSRLGWKLAGTSAFDANEATDPSQAAEPFLAFEVSPLMTIRPDARALLAGRKSARLFHAPRWRA